MHKYVIDGTKFGVQADVHATAALPVALPRFPLKRAVLPIGSVLSALPTAPHASAAAVRGPEVALGTHRLAAAAEAAGRV